MNKVLAALQTVLNDFCRPGHLRALAYGAVSVLVLNAIAVPIGLGLQIVLARTLGLAHYGYYEFVIALLSILVLFATRGTELSLTRFIAAYASQNQADLLHGIVGWAGRVCLVNSLIIGILMATASVLLINDSELRLALVVGAFLLPLWAQNNLRQSALKGFRQVVRGRFPDTVLRPVLLVVSILAYDAFNHALSAAEALTLHSLAAGLVLMYGAFLLRQSLKNFPLANSAAEDQVVWTQASWSLMLIAILFIALNELDKILVGWLQGAEALGLYAAASKLTVLIIFGLEAVNTIAAPLISELSAASRHKQLQTLVSYATLVSTAISLPIAAALGIWGRLVLELNGVSFAGAYPILLILLVGQCIQASFGPQSFLLMMTGKQSEMLSSMIVSLAALLVFNLTFSYYYGVLGAAVATVIANLVRNLLLWRLSRQCLQLDSSLFFAVKRVVSVLRKSQSSIY